MTMVVMAMGDGGPPPTADLLAKFAGGDPDDHPMPGMVLHFPSGTVAGGVFAVGASLDQLTVATGLGVGYGVLM